MLCVQNFYYVRATVLNTNKISHVIVRTKKSLNFREVQIQTGAIPQPKWEQGTVRVGVIARKVGMTQLFDRWGVSRTLTELKIDCCQVVQVKTDTGRIALQMGAGAMKLKKVKKPMFYHFEKAGVWPKAILKEFPVSENCLLPVGTEILARHFVPGQFVDVSGTTKGKGFAGPMKRWGFKGLPASHGVSVSHRSHGSMGSCQDPGRVFPGKKMAGHMGHERRTVLNLQVYKIDCMNNSIFVEGCVPGPKKSWVEIRDSVLKNFQFDNELPPLPTYFPGPGDESIKFLERPPAEKNPLAPYGLELSMEDWIDWQKKHLDLEGVEERLKKVKKQDSNLIQLEENFEDEDVDNDENELEIDEERVATQVKLSKKEVKKVAAANETKKGSSTKKASSTKKSSEKSKSKSKK
eukprot:c3430_g1_i1.p1 GENE.c3430_g1_i1~~c3430_g1_i1.p1  ORF type:complete len:419 (+),score=176.66 c3430_g1_i1:38-1258(+)